MTRPSGTSVNADRVTSEELRGGGQRATPVFSGSCRRMLAGLVVITSDFMAPCDPSDATQPPDLKRVEFLFVAGMFFLIGFFAVLNIGGRP